MTDKRTWTVHELIEELNSLTPHLKVNILDADTDYIIEKFSVIDCGDGEVTFFPCNYNEMRK